MSHHTVPLTGYQPNLQTWFDHMRDGESAESLEVQLHNDVVFHSPVVHTPQRGKAITMAYLLAAGQTLGQSSFGYVRVIDGGDNAMLEFVADMEGIKINGVDIIKWDENGKIIEFKVMVRPLKAVQKVHEDMGKMLATMNSKG